MRTWQGGPVDVVGPRQSLGGHHLLEVQKIVGLEGPQIKLVLQRRVDAEKYVDGGLLLSVGKRVAVVACHRVENVPRVRGPRRRLLRPPTPKKGGKKEKKRRRRRARARGRRANITE